MTKASSYLRVAAASPELRVADIRYNTQKIIDILELAAEQGVSVLCLPELCLTAYSSGDLFYQELLLEQAEAAVAELAAASRAWPNLLFTVGLPLRHENLLYNTALLISDGTILGAVPKQHLPNSWEFYEDRWFTSGMQLPEKAVQTTVAGQRITLGGQLFDLNVNNRSVLIGVEICEDLWVPVPPSTEMALDGALLILNLSASNEIVGKSDYRRQLIQQQSARLHAAYLYSDAGPDESTTDLVFSGHSLIAENGKLLAESELFHSGADSLIYADIDLDLLLSERRHNKSFGSLRKSSPVLSRTFVPTQFESVAWDDIRRFIDPHPFVPADPATRDERCRDVFAIQAQGLIKRLRHTRAAHAVIGVSGGLDSTLALLVCVQSFEKMGRPASDIIGITMPGHGTSGATYQNAIALMKHLGVTVREIPIRDAVEQHFEDIGHDPALHDITYENSQARERTQILMDVANQVGGIVVGTGDLSELALGWCTYNGDQMSMYGVNASIPKTLVKHLIRWRAERAADKGRDEISALLQSILAIPISPELLPPDADGNFNQLTEDTTGPYELHDFFLYNILRYSADPVKVYHLALLAFEGKEDYQPQIILGWLLTFYQRFFSQQFKRSAMPDGPKVGTVSLSPRGDWRMPSDASADLWLAELEQLKAAAEESL